MEEKTNYTPGYEPAESPVYRTPVQTIPVQPKKKPSAGKIAAAVLALIAVAGAAFAAGTHLSGKEASSPAPAADAGSRETQRAETDTKPAGKETGSPEITPAENHGTPLPGGRYTIGEDLPAGKYLFVYKTTMESDYWTNDYLWITYAGSEGTNETWGGDKYDDRVGSVKYEDALVGKSFYFSLHDGDSLLVDSEFGEWTY